MSKREAWQNNIYEIDGQRYATGNEYSAVKQAYKKAISIKFDRYLGDETWRYFVFFRKTWRDVVFFLATERENHGDCQESCWA